MRSRLNKVVILCFYGCAQPYFITSRFIQPLETVLFSLTSLGVKSGAEDHSSQCQYNNMSSSCELRTDKTRDLDLSNLTGARHVLIIAFDRQLICLKMDQSELCHDLFSSLDKIFSKLYAIVIKMRK